MPAVFMVIIIRKRWGGFWDAVGGIGEAGLEVGDSGEVEG